MEAAGRGAGVALTATAAAAAVIIAVAWAVDASPMATGEGWPVRTVVIAGIAVLWLLAARRTVPPLVLAGGVALAVSWLNYDRLTDARSGGPSLVIMLLAVVWTALAGTRAQTVVAVLLGLLTSLTYLFDGDLPSIAGMSLVTVLSAVAARSYAGQQRVLAELERAQRSLAEQAVANERARIAKEVHDVAAHSLAITMLHLTGARMLARRLGADPQIVDVVDAAERAGRESMTELRAAVGLLRPMAPAGVPAGEDEPGAAPTPTGADIAALVEQYREAGLPVTLELVGEADALPSLVGLAAYRVVQEGLANTVRHAGRVPVVVRVEVGDSCRVSVTDAGGGPARRAEDAAGHGLVGMRQRVGALDGALTFGPHDGGWRVEARLPLTTAEPR